MSFRRRAGVAVRDEKLRRALKHTTDKVYGGRLAAVAGLRTAAAAGLTLGDFSALRTRARAIRRHTLDHLDGYLARAADAIRAAGAEVHWAADAAEAVAVVQAIFHAHGARLAVKSKSMVTEEIHLNKGLALSGAEVVETDLGEFIIQLAGESPSHIIMPVIHKSRDDIAALFSTLVGQPVATDTPALTRVARAALRGKFLAADIGISGANFVVAESGTVALVTNEGNGRYCTSLPRVHIALVGIEKVVPTLADLSVLLALLPRSASGQPITSYVHLVTGPRRPGETDGPDELHVVFLDNGRRDILGGPFGETLNCIRCGACLNTCPVYRVTGGHAYGSVYPGPIGAVLTPLLQGVGETGAVTRAPEVGAGADLPGASSLCGACHEVCPVGIPLHEYLVGLRQVQVAHGRNPWAERLAMRAVAWAWTRPWAYRLAAAWARRLAPFAARRGPLAAWRQGRTEPRLAPKTFRQIWAERGEGRP